MARKIDHIELMLYVDGELDEATARDVAERLARDPEARRVAEGLEHTHEAVRTHLELAADEVEPRLDALWATIERRVQANGASQAAAASAPASAPESSGLLAAIGRWLESVRGHIAFGAVAAATTAALVLALRPAREIVIERPIVLGQHEQRGVLPPAGDGHLRRVKEESRPPAIEELEVTGGSGTIFVIPSDSADDISATVIFVDMNDVEGPL